jgi:hypothetical protein
MSTSPNAERFNAFKAAWRLSKALSESTLVVATPLPPEHRNGLSGLAALARAGFGLQSICARRFGVRAILRFARLLRGRSPTRDSERFGRNVGYLCASVGQLFGREGLRRGSTIVGVAYPRVASDTYR